ncbi:MAG: hypothetical protein P1U74_07025 [Legionellaceae bacterium]|nr:hypothetical protein [Legionellaceae bacterium]
MLATRIRQKIDEAKKRTNESEEIALRTRRLNTRLALEQRFLENPKTREKQALNSPKEKPFFLAKRLVEQESVEKNRVFSGCGETVFFRKKNMSRASSDICQKNIMDATAKQKEQEKTRRHSSPELRFNKK